MNPCPIYTELGIRSNMGYNLLRKLINLAINNTIVDVNPYIAIHLFEHKANTI